MFFRLVIIENELLLDIGMSQLLCQSYQGKHVQFAQVAISDGYSNLDKHGVLACNHPFCTAVLYGNSHGAGSQVLTLEIRACTCASETLDKWEFCKGHFHVQDHIPEVIQQVDCIAIQVYALV